MAHEHIEAGRILYPETSTKQRPNEHIEKITIPGNGSPAALRGIRLAVIMQGIKERSIDQGSRPDHRRRLHEVFPHQACHTEIDTLCRESKHDIETPTEILTIEPTLGHNRIGKVPNTVSKATLAMITVSPCSLGLKVPGLRFHSKPNDLNVRLGIM